MEYEAHEKPGRATATALREVLDEAVRRLAVSSDELWERVAASSLILGRLSRADFPAADRKLLDQVRLQVMRLDLAGHTAYELGDAEVEVSDEALEAIAADILALRDRALMRALVDPPVAS
jgi:hypothetical protein